MHNAPDPTTRPTRITRLAEERQVLIAWGDGHESRYDWEYLRWRCACAFCHGEWGAGGMLDQVRSLSPEQTDLRGMAHVGHYAISLTWADGHNTGIFVFRNLRAMCPCPACVGES